MSDAFASMWIRFVCSLVSARGEWLVNVLTRSIKGLSYREWRSLSKPASEIRLDAHTARCLLGSAQALTGAP